MRSYRVVPSAFRMRKNPHKTAKKLGVELFSQVKSCFRGWGRSVIIKNSLRHHASNNLEMWPISQCLQLDPGRRLGESRGFEDENE